MKRKETFSREGLARIKDRFKVICSKYDHIDHEDVFQAWCLNVLSGKGRRQTLDQFLIDYSRKNKFCSKAYKATPRFREYFETDTKVDPKPNATMELEALIKGLPLREKIVLRLRVLWGFDYSEIGDLLEISKGRVSQILKTCAGRFDV